MLPLDWPDAGLVEAETLEQQSRAVAEQLPHRPLVLGGCCCSHIGAIRAAGGAPRALAVVWLDAHGDLNTPETSPSGNAWGMPLRMAIDEGSVRPGRRGARRRAQPRPARGRVHGRESASTTTSQRALADTDAVYVALDLDVLRPGEATPSCPSPAGLRSRRSRTLLRALPRVDGLGFSGTPRARSATSAPLTRLARAARL